MGRLKHQPVWRGRTELLGGYLFDLLIPCRASFLLEVCVWKQMSYGGAIPCDDATIRGDQSEVISLSVEDACGRKRSWVWDEPFSDRPSANLAGRVSHSHCLSTLLLLCNAFCPLEVCVWKVAGSNISLSGEDAPNHRAIPYSTHLLHVAHFFLPKVCVWHLDSGWAGSSISLSGGDGPSCREATHSRMHRTAE